MSQAPAGTDEDELNQAARKVLLDALIALEGHREALTVVGAQAVYLRTIDAAISSASYTSDGDISIDPDVLGEQPLLEEAMHAAGFTLKLDKNGNQQVGLWERTEQVGELEVGVEVDLLVPENLAPGPKKKRRTEMPPHDGWAAKKVPGLEVAAVDRSLMTISSLTPHDARSVEAYVAGPAALLVAKAYKLHERIIDAEKGKANRLSAKDAGDVYRIMATVPPRQVKDAFDTLCKDPRVGAVATEGLHLLRQLFGGAATPGTELAIQALAGDIPESRIRVLVPAFMSRLGEN
ncbi:hypothetical protein AB0L28_34225 [Streptomyces sp. NPDC052503]|uniref:hypothetical protein n=1 Tax=Streptomyces sp. NPDC052503 TaxID=3156683 RepID=UPI00136D3477|nr:hypothetical protein [Streptomyces sp. SID7834]MYT60749.1 hypothetical protein [Streptomyces sp. SID7834]